MTPVGEGLVGVAVLSDAAPAARRPAGGTSRSSRSEPAGQAAEQVRGAGPLRQRSRRRVAGRVLLVGDASGYVDALTGEGIALGLAQARAAVEAVRVGRARDYELAWRRLGWRHDLLTQGLLTATRHPALRSRVVPAAARMPAVFGLAVNQLARPA